MKRILLFILPLLCSTILNAQSAEDLNNQSKKFITKNDYQGAFPLIKEAAEKGNAEAQCNYGLYFKKGIIVPQNDSIAFFWISKSANQGCPKGEMFLASYYADGIFVKPDMSKFFEWTKKCALLGEPDCMWSMSSFYKNGIIVKANSDSMIYWQIKTAKLNITERDEFKSEVVQARVNLAEWYRDGYKIPIDLVKSYAWYLIYNEDKKYILGLSPEMNIKAQENNINAIKELEKNLTASEKLKGVSIAETIMGHKLKNIRKIYIIEN
jgi:TPR repeat protein